MKQPDISIFIPTLEGGGAEKIVVGLANHWAKKGYEVDIVLVEAKGEFLQRLSPKVRVKNLNKKRIRSTFIPLIKYLFSTKPKILWANMWPLTSLAVLASYLAPGRHKIFITDHVQLTQSNRYELRRNYLVLKSIIALTYSLADGVSAVSKGVAAEIARIANIPAAHIQVIYNPYVFLGDFETKKTEQSLKLWPGKQHLKVLAVGSLKVQKNHDMLIRAFQKVSKHLDCQLVILGDGPLRRRLGDRINELELNEIVYLCGFQIDPEPWYKDADLFVLSSDWEGFANVIVEALCHGIPVVSTDCQSGPREILEDGRFGLLVPVGDEVQLADSIIAQLKTSHDRDALITRGNQFDIKTASVSYLKHFGFEE